MKKIGKTDKEIKQTKNEKIMNTVAWRTAYYRENPQRFVKDFLNINLKFFAPSTLAASIIDLSTLSTPVTIASYIIGKIIKNTIIIGAIDGANKAIMI